MARSFRLPVRQGVGRSLVSALVGVALLASCAYNDGATEQDNTGGVAVRNGIIGVQDAGGDPVSGGTLTFAGYAFITGFDPAKTQASGATGGTEMAAIYDLLMGWDAASGTFEPQLAQSLRPSDDLRTWTLSLRDGVTFSDGSQVTSEAVVASIDRYNANKGANAQVWTSSVAEMQTPDPRTVVFVLNQPWSEFPAMLAGGHGMILAPASYAGEKFTPIGAGPFTVKRFMPNEELLLNRRADYWNGMPYLDTLRFVPIVGDQAKVEALDSGGVQAVYLRSAEVVARAMAANRPGYVDTSSLGSIVLVNNRPGRPGADVRVRQAMAYATNVDTFDQRVLAGEGLPGAEIFQPWSKWHGDVAPVGFDPAKAKELLDAAKHDGFDGKVTYVGLADPAAQQSALTIQAMLQAVGFTVTIDYQNNTADLVKKMYAEHDFDLAYGAFSLFDSAPYIRLFSAMQSTSTNNALGYADPRMDAALAAVQAAPGDDAKRTALDDVQSLVNETTPFLTLGALATFIPWQQNVHGVRPSFDAILLFDKAWIGI
ncbi:MAG: ABC transporter substrate-binding protein [Nocardiaceae bacterium]|nr:ABC transporter substrate-binding protein [Nocardiaceae bacterium]